MFFQQQQKKHRRYHDTQQCQRRGQNWESLWETLPSVLYPASPLTAATATATATAATAAAAVRVPATAADWSEPPSAAGAPSMAADWSEPLSPLAASLEPPWVYDPVETFLK